MKKANEKDQNPFLIHALEKIDLIYSAVRF